MAANRNGLWMGIGLALVALCGVCLAVAPARVEGARLVIRVTARTSFLLFLPVLAASPLHRLWPGAATQALVRVRRSLGLGFAVSHGLHLMAIIAFWRFDPALFWSVSGVGNIISGGIAYLFIAAMAVTSFSPWREALGPARWRLLHSIGLWYIALSFIVTNGKRVMMHPAYAMPPLLVILVLAVRGVMAARARRRA